MALNELLNFCPPSLLFLSIHPIISSIMLISSKFQFFNSVNFLFMILLHSFVIKFISYAGTRVWGLDIQVQIEWAFSRDLDSSRMQLMLSQSWDDNLLQYYLYMSIVCQYQLQELHPDTILFFSSLPLFSNKVQKVLLLNSSSHFPNNSSSTSILCIWSLLNMELSSSSSCSLHTQCDKSLRRR